MQSPWKILLVTAIICSLTCPLSAKEVKKESSITLPTLAQGVLPNAGRSWQGFFADERDDELDLAFGFKSEIERVPYNVQRALHTMIFAGWKNEDAKLLLLAAQMLLTQEELHEADELFSSADILHKASELAVKQKNKKLVQTIAKVWQRGIGLNDKKMAAKYKKIGRSLAPPKKTRGGYYHFAVFHRYGGEYVHVIIVDDREMNSHRRRGHYVSREGYNSIIACRKAAIKKEREFERRYAGQYSRRPQTRPTPSKIKFNRVLTHGSSSSSGSSKWFKKAPKYNSRSNSSSSLDDFLKSDPFGSSYKRDRKVVKMPKYKSFNSGSKMFQTLDDLMGSSSKPYLLLKKPSKYTGDKLTIVVNGSNAHKYHMRSGYRVISGHSSKLEASYAMRHHSRYGNLR